MEQRILVLNGANMNTLGKRDAGALGAQTLEDIMADLERYAAQQGVAVECVQSNHEGELIERIQTAAEGFHGIILNPGSFGHYSFGLKEAIDAAGIPCIEVHLANFFRKPENHSVPAASCRGVVCGFGAKSYHVAIDGLLKIL